MSKKRTKKHTAPLEPQQYQDRVEKALQALTATISATQHLSTYMAEQLGPEWKDLDYLLESADRDLIEARRWLRGARISRSRARTRGSRSRRTGRKGGSHGK